MFGAYQVGAWKALSREISPDIVVGTSVGALNGWYIAGGAAPEELERDWLDPVSAAPMKFRFPRLPWKGIFDPQALEWRVKTLVNNYKPRVDYGLTLVDLPKLRLTLVCNADVTWRHLLAACAVPVGYPPVRIGGRLYCDGGLLDPVPVWAAADMGATRVIAVNAAHFIPPPGLASLIKGLRSIAAKIEKERARAAGAPEVVLITPSEPLGKMLDGAKWRPEKIRRWIEMGEADAAAALESIRALQHCSG